MTSPHTTTSLQGHASMRTDLGIHQQRHDHPDSEVRGPLKTRELAPNYTFGKHIQDPYQNFSQKDLRIPPSHD
jgi:hypothetical protein